QDPGDRRIGVQLLDERDRARRSACRRELDHARPNSELLAELLEATRVDRGRLVPPTPDDRQSELRANHPDSPAQLLLQRAGGLPSVQDLRAHDGARSWTIRVALSTSSRPAARARASSRRSREPRTNSASSTPPRLSRTLSSADASAAAASSAPTAASEIRYGLPSSAASTASSRSSAERSATRSGTTVLARRAV